MQLCCSIIGASLNKTSPYSVCLHVTYKSGLMLHMSTHAYKYVSVRHILMYQTIGNHIMLSRHFIVAHD